MANLTPLLSRPILTKDDVSDMGCVFRIPEDTWQLQIDTLNVMEGRVPLSNFDPEYQEIIRNYYRFSATRGCSDSVHPANVTKDTLDII